MEAFNLLKQACLNKQFTSFKDLPVGEYVVSEFTLMQTRFGPSIKVDIGDKIVFLPKRFSKGMTEEKVAALNTVPQILVFSGIDHDRHDT